MFRLGLFSLLLFCHCAAPPALPTPSFEANIQQTEIHPGEPLKLTLTFTDMVLQSANIGTVPIAGEGHFRAYLDGETGNKYLPHAPDDFYTILLPTDLATGKHSLRIVLFQNDGHPFDPNVEKTLPIEVTKKVIIVPPKTPVINATLAKTKVSAGDTLALNIDVKNFTLKKPSTNPLNRSNEGYYKIFLDTTTDTNLLHSGNLPSATDTLPAETTPGGHKLIVQLVQNDGSPVTPPITKELSFEVLAPVPTLSLALDIDEVEAGETLTLTVDANNFELSQANIGGANKSGQGHYKVYLDKIADNRPLIASAIRYQLLTVPKETTGGTHKFIVQLVNNDGTPRTPAVTGEVSFKVNAEPTNACAQEFTTNTKCTTFTDRTATSAKREIITSGNTYSPKCIKIKVGQSVNFKHNLSSHPLKQVCGPANVIPETKSGTSKVVKFTKEGIYGYYCTRHGKVSGTGMAGMIQVVK